MTKAVDSLNALRARVDEAIGSFVPRGDGTDTDLTRALQSGVTGGKRLRPVLVMATAEAVGGSPGDALPAAVALEFIHTCSLILDDLPSMDDARERRGRPALHVEFGEATAVLASYALLVEAFHILGTLPERVAGGGRREAVLRSVSDALGLQGLIGGQFLDLQARLAPGLDVPLETVHERKTASLFAAGAFTGALLGGAPEDVCASLRAFGRRLGHAFQHVDDALDQDTLGGLHGRPAAETFTHEARQLLAPLHIQTDTLVTLADLMLHRRT